MIVIDFAIANERRPAHFALLYDSSIRDIDQIIMHTLFQNISACIVCMDANTCRTCVRLFVARYLTRGWILDGIIWSVVTFRLIDYSHVIEICCYVFVRIGVYYNWVCFFPARVLNAKAWATNQRGRHVDDATKVRRICYHCFFSALETPLLDIQCILLSNVSWTFSKYVPRYGTISERTVDYALAYLVCGAGLTQCPCWFQSKICRLPDKFVKIRSS